MPGWGTSKSRPEVASARETHGSVRIPGESEPLRVVITFSGSTIAMRADDLELGSWSAADVKISRIDPWSFAFVAEGDRLVFVPDDAKAFAASPFARTPERSDTGATKQPRTMPRLRVTRRKSESPPPQRSVDRAPKPPPTRSSQPQSRDNQKAGPKKKANEKASDTKRETTWLRAVDAARERGLFGLDRVQVSASLRGAEHQHTYDHGASSKTGLGHRICTICGKVRLRG